MPSPPDPGAISVGTWIRLAARLQNPNQPEALDALVMDQLYLVASFRGRMTEWLKWYLSVHANVPATGSAPPYPSVGALDLIVKIEPHPLFNLWVGRMAIAVDRDLLSGPWFINYWTFTGYLGSRPGPALGLRTGPNGRDNGVTLWGKVRGGQLRYYLGAFNLDSRSPGANPMFTARLNLDLLDPEPGYYHQSAYHGDKDILSIGAGAQYQKEGTAAATPPATPGGMPGVDLGTLTVVTADLLIDKRLGTAGVATFQAAGYFLDRRQPVRRFYNLDLGYTLPHPIGPGLIAPAVRYQFTVDPGYRQVDGYIQYLVKSHFAKFLLGFVYTDLAGVRSRAVQAGIQIVKI